MPPCATRIRFDHVAVRHGAISVLEDVSASIPRGGSTMIIGPNGAGKTTLLLALLGEVAFTGGISFECEGKPRFGYVPQRIPLDRGLPLTVLEFLCSGVQKRPLWLGMPRALKERSLALLESVQAAHLAKRRLGDLSGGELQRVLLALALARNPDVLVLDELSAGMDWAGDHMFCELLENLRAKLGFTQIMVSHDLGMVAHHATHVLCLKRSLVAEGAPCDVFTPAVMTALFGLHMGVMPKRYGELLIPPDCRHA